MFYLLYCEVKISQKLSYAFKSTDSVFTSLTW